MTSHVALKGPAVPSELGRYLYFELLPRAPCCVIVRVYNLLGVTQISAELVARQCHFQSPSDRKLHPSQSFLVTLRPRLTSL